MTFSFYAILRTKVPATLRKEHGRIFRKRGEILKFCGEILKFRGRIFRKHDRIHEVRRKPPAHRRRRA